MVYFYDFVFKLSDTENVCFDILKPDILKGMKFIHPKCLFLPGIVIHMLLTLENCSVIFCMFAPFLPMMYLCSHAGAATSDKTLLLACRI
jgi:hypothetical protein